MKRRNHVGLAVALLAAAALVATVHLPLSAQAPDAAKGGKGGKGGPGGPGGGKGGPQAVLPKQPTAVALPQLSEKISGPGPMFDTGKAHWPGHGPEAYKYEVDEYFVSGTAQGKPYKTRLAIRRPMDNKKFSGLIMTEPMHFSGNAHGYGYNAIYIMTSGHVAAEIVTTSLNLFTDFNKDRYGTMQATPDQTNEILAQVGSLIRSKQGPLGSLPIRKEILWGTSASSAIVVNYLPAHAVYRTPDMKEVYDGFLATSNGGVIAKTDVPMIQVPTQNEYRNNPVARPDGDAPGDQYRVYEFAGMGHLDARFDPRLVGACANPLSTFPMEAYMSVSLYHLFRWVDKGIVPPRAPRVDTDTDGKKMALDANGEAKGGIRSPYLDLPVYKYIAPNVAAPGKGADAAQLCGLSNYLVPIPADKLKTMYKDKKNYVKSFEARLKDLEKAGWSLPVYHSLLMEDAKQVNF